MTVWTEPVTLQNDHIELIPLASEHVKALIEAATDGALWELGFTTVPRPEAMQAYVETALRLQLEGAALAFCVQDRKSGRVLGSTRYCNLDPSNRRLEIGYTWYRQSSQRSGANTACKQLMLQHAFETLECIAVEFRTHWHNHRSRAAIERLGAKQDGVLRQHRIMADGTFRDTVVFSILDNEWPAVKSHLRGLAQRHGDAHLG